MISNVQTLLLIPLSNGIDNLNSQEDFDSLWDSWNDFVFAALNIFCAKGEMQTNKPSSLDYKWASQGYKQEEDNVEAY